MLVVNHGHLSARAQLKRGADQALLFSCVDSTVDTTPRITLRGLELRRCLYPRKLGAERYLLGSLKGNWNIISQRGLWMRRSGFSAVSN